VAALATPGLLPELESATGKTYAAGIDESIEGDENRGSFIVKLIERHSPEFVTAYLTALDHEQHAEGPGTPKAYAVLERIDAIVGKLVAAQLAAHPDSAVAIASDHGFEAIDKETNFFRAFVDAGLIKLDAAAKVISWEAMPWPSGGSVAIVLDRDDDPHLTARVAQVLNSLKAEPANGIAAIADRTEIARMGGNPKAAFYVNMAPHATAVGTFAITSALRGTAKYKGTHGYFPIRANLQATFLVMGQGIPKARSLGEIDMRAIAPTIASLLDITLPESELDPLIGVAAGK